MNLMLMLLKKINAARDSRVKFFFFLMKISCIRSVNLPATYSFHSHI